MKAPDHDRAFGAVLGKTMQPLAKGEIARPVPLTATGRCVTTSDANWAWRCTMAAHGPAAEPGMVI